MKVQGYDVLEINRLYGNVKDVLTEDYLISFYAKINKRNKFGSYENSFVLLRFKEEEERDEVYHKMLKARDTIRSGLAPELEELYKRISKEEKITQPIRFFD